MVDVDFYMDNACKSSGQIPCPDLVAVHSHPNFNVCRIFSFTLASSIAIAWLAWA